MRLMSHVTLVLALVTSASSVAAEPRVLEPLPLPGRFTDLHRSSKGALLVSYGAWSEWGGARLSWLRRNGKWMQVPAGGAFEWGGWLVFEGLFPVPHHDDQLRSPWDGGTRIIGLGTDDSFVRRVVMVELASGRTFEAPWDSLAPLPLGNGETWLVWRCPFSTTPDARIELVAWSPRSGRTRTVGFLPGEADSSCAGGVETNSLSVVVFPDGGFPTPWGSTSFAYGPAVLPTHDGALAHVLVDGGTQWVQLDGRGRVMRVVLDAGVELSASPHDAGSPLVPLRRLDEAFVDQLSVMGRTKDGGVAFPLTPSLGGGFAVTDGLIFADEGVFVGER